MSINQNLKIVICILLVLAGLIVLAWPEENNLMLVQLSESHGPSLLDSVGLAFIFLGYIPMVVQVFRNFSSIRARVGKMNIIALVVIIVASGALIPVTLINESELMLWISVAICTIAEGILIFFAFRRSA